MYITDSLSSPPHVQPLPSEAALPWLTSDCGGVILMGQQCPSYVMCYLPSHWGSWTWVGTVLVQREPGTLVRINCELIIKNVSCNQHSTFNWLLFDWYQYIIIDKCNHTFFLWDTICVKVAYMFTYNTHLTRHTHVHMRPHAETRGGWNHTHHAVLHHR